MIRETAYKTLENISKIADPETRKATLRQTLMENNPLAIVVQRVYHPNYHFDLPAGDVPDTIAKKSNHDEHGPFYNNLRRWDVLRPTEEVPSNVNIRKNVREQQFISLYEAVSNDDTELLIAVKNKKLPWETLNLAFVVDALPELFPDSFRQNPTTTTYQSEPQVNVQSIETNQVELSQQNIFDEFKTEGMEIIIDPTIPTVDNTKSGKQKCIEIMQNNPGLTRKEYLKLFEQIGVKQSTGAMYYQQLKK